MSLEKMKDMAHQYIKIRNENASYIGVPHRDKNHFHVHLCISAVEAKTGKAVRISRTEFKEVKEKIQQFQISKYPELSNSIVNHSQKAKQPIQESEYQQKKRGGMQSEKEKVKQQLENIFKAATSKTDFYSKVQGEGLAIYERGGKFYGIEGDRNMRFSTLGFADTRLQELDSYQDRMKGLDIARETTDDSRVGELYEDREQENKGDKDVKENNRQDQENIEEYQDERESDINN
jgi:hypothetical protein